MKVRAASLAMCPAEPQAKRHHILFSKTNSTHCATILLAEEDNIAGRRLAGYRGGDIDADYADLEP